MRNILVAIIFLFYYSFSYAQFTRADTLRGSDGPGRNWWDVTKYDLHVKFNVEHRSISGYNTIQFKKLKEGHSMQIDLQDPLIIDSVSLLVPDPSQPGMYSLNHTIKGDELSKNGNSYFISTINYKLQTTNYLIIYYHGKPQVALRPPWDGGLIYKRDERNRPWLSVACQGLGASVWYPCKDYQGDEPDSAELHITAPSEFVSISNGNLRSKTDNTDGTSTYSWAVTNPINNYNIIPYIGKYVNFNEVYKGEKGDLQMNYWVLDYNLEKAKKQFKDAPKMMKAFEHWFDPYPFYEDGYKLVDAPHLGMEHQSAIAYGNDYQMGYKDRGDMSKTGWGLKWDFIIVHESGHEWFGNSITSKDIADMWIHESFTNYSETLFTEYYYGKKAGSEYVIGTRDKIENDIPIIGVYGVNKEGSGDMYPKGGNMLHTIRQVINDDEKFRMILRGLNKTFYHQTVTTKQIEDYMSKTSGKDLSKIFDQYLRTVMIPTLEYKVNGGNLTYRWVNIVKGFNMPVKINFKGQRWINPSGQWQTLKLYPEGKSAFSVDENFYINTKKVT